MNKFLVLIDFDKYNDEPEFKETLFEFFSSLDDTYFFSKYKINKDLLDRIITAENVITFKVKWIDDNDIEHINNGYRVQHSNKNGPYKGGLRFHPSVNLSILKSLALEQTFKNILTTLPMGGAKGGSDFDPKGKSENEIKTFCKAFMKELYPFIGVNNDIPAGDIGVGSKEIETMYLAYKEYSGKSDCALTGKPINLGGSLLRKEATGYGLVYFASEALKKFKLGSFKGKKVIISGSGNVALYACKKVIELGGIVIGMSDSSNAIYVPDGIDFETIRELKEDKKARIKEYALIKENVIVLNSSKEIWKIKCDVALPCATQFELDEFDAKELIDNGVIGVFEGANIASTYKAANLLINNKVIYSPGKASNAGGVSVSYLEILQNKKHQSWSTSKVDKKLSKIMKNIFNNVERLARKLGNKYNLLSGSNNHSFERLIELYNSK